MWKPDFSYSGLETVIQSALKEYENSLDDRARVKHISIAVQQIKDWNIEGLGKKKN